MRFMVIVKASKDSEAGVMPSTELLTAMGKLRRDAINKRFAAEINAMYAAANERKAAAGTPA